MDIITLPNPQYASPGPLVEYVQQLPSERQAELLPAVQELCLSGAFGKEPAQKQTPFSSPPGSFTGAELLSMQLPEITWIIPDLLPAGLTILGGRPKCGKSWMAMDFGISVACGGHAFGVTPVEEGEVLYLALEDNPRRLQGRLHKRLASTPASKGNPKLSNITFATEWPTLDKGAIEKIESWLDEHSNARLIILDTFKYIRPKRNGRGNAYDDDYSDMIPLQRLAGERNIAVLLVHHVRKMESEDPIDMLSGTLGISGGADTIWVLARDKKSGHPALYLRGREVEEQSIPLRWDSDLALWCFAPDDEYAGMSMERRQIIEVVRKVSQPVMPKDLYSFFPQKTEGAVRKLMNQMVGSGELVRNRDGRYTVPNQYSNHSSNRGNSSNNSYNSNNTNHTGNSPVPTPMLPLFDSGGKPLSGVTTVTTVTSTTDKADRVDLEVLHALAS